MGLRVDVGLERCEAPEVVSEDASEPPGPVLIGSRGVVHTTCNQESSGHFNIVVCEADLYILMLYVCALVYLVQNLTY